MPMNNAIIKGKQFCESPCPAQQWVYSDQTCHTSCTSPKVQEVLHTNNLCLSSTGLSETEKSLVSVGSKASVGIIMLGSVTSICSSFVITFLFVAKLIAYIKYLRISYSPYLQTVFQNSAPDLASLGIIPGLSKKIQNHLMAEDIPEVFTQYGVDPTFLANFWQDFCILSVVFGAYILIATILLCSIVKTSTPKLYWILRKSRLIVINFLIAYLYGGSGDIIFYTILEIRSINLSSTASKLSLTLSLIFTTLILGLFCLHLWIVYRYQKLNKEASITPDGVQRLRLFLQSYESLEIFYADFHDTSLAKQICLAIFTIRSIIVSILLATFYQYPLGQCVLFIAISICYILYLATFRPYRNKGEQIQQYFFEIAALTANIIALIMAIMDAAKTEGTSSRKRLEKGYTVLGTVVNAAITLLIVFQILKLLVRKIKSWMGGSKVRPELVQDKAGELSAIPEQQNTNHLGVNQTNLLEISTQNPQLSSLGDVYIHQNPLTRLNRTKMNRGVPSEQNSSQMKHDSPTTNFQPSYLDLSVVLPIAEYKPKKKRAVNREPERRSGGLEHPKADERRRNKKKKKRQVSETSNVTINGLTGNLNQGNIDIRTNDNVLNFGNIDTLNVEDLHTTSFASNNPSRDQSRQQRRVSPEKGQRKKEIGQSKY